MKKQDIVSEIIKLFEIFEIWEKKDVEVKNQKYAEAARLRDLEKGLIKQFKKRIEKWN